MSSLCIMYMEMFFFYPLEVQIKARSKFRAEDDV